MDDLEQHEIREQSQADQIKKQLYEFIHIKNEMHNYKDKTILLNYIDNIMKSYSESISDSMINYLEQLKNDIKSDFFGVSELRYVSELRENVLNHPKTNEFNLSKVFQDYLKIDFKDFDTVLKRKKAIDKLSDKVSVAFEILQDYESIRNFLLEHKNKPEVYRAIARKLKDNQYRIYRQHYSFDIKLVKDTVEFDNFSINQISIRSIDRQR